MFPFATFGTPGIFCLPHPEGEPCITMYQMQFFPEYKTFIFRPRVYSHALGWGARKGPGPRCKCGSRPSFVARALGIFKVAKSGK